MRSLCEGPRIAPLEIHIHICTWTYIYMRDALTLWVTFFFTSNSTPIHYVFMQIYICVYVCIHVYIYMCFYTSVCVMPSHCCRQITPNSRPTCYVFIYMYSCIYMCTKHTNTHTHTLHSHSHTHTHARAHQSQHQEQADPLRAADADPSGKNSQKSALQSIRIEDLAAIWLLRNCTWRRWK